jgi:hypothetical protein
MDSTLVRSSWYSPIAIDKDDVVWMGTTRGVLSYNGTTWRSYPECHVGGTSVAVDENNVKWFTGYQGVASFDGTTWKHYTTSDAL